MSNRIHTEQGDTSGLLFRHTHGRWMAKHHGGWFMLMPVQDRWDAMFIPASGGLPVNALMEFSSFEAARGWCIAHAADRMTSVASAVTSAWTGDHAGAS